MGDEREDFGGAWVNVWGVEAAGFEEESCKGYAEAGQGWEVGSIGEDDFAAQTWCARIGGWVEVEFEVSGSVAYCFLKGLHARGG